MKIVVDENMPYAIELFSQFGEVVALSGRTISAEDLNDVDALMVRSVTQVNEALLMKANKLAFVGTATIGIDHLDQALLQQRNITYTNAPGCNAVSVGDYVCSALLVLAEQQSFVIADKKIAVIGVGNTGVQTVSRLTALGAEVMLCDPPRVEKEGLTGFVSLEQALQADIICMHVPLVKTGDNQTKHLLTSELLAGINQDAILVNCGRGDVIDNQALLDLKQAGHGMTLVLDVWENEPTPLLDLIPYATIATPHIAGYSLEGKARGTQMIYQAYAQLLGQPAERSISDILPVPAVSRLDVNQNADQTFAKSLVHLVYDVRRDDAIFRKNIMKAGSFDEMRKNYLERREFSSLRLVNDSHYAVESLYQLGFAK
ncbi:4-phosphoerythronate dehydrogenase [Moritella marina ATCC 15381]|uniref:Erythronate-4-phosphate dehydrogenase n=1 Tax=Moritella marina ATCC 15381 TaxID=1202962 RepID=A0A5J6WG53_MORMI|nr:4-phosphoerythronate dehydrogenase [Moritella marina]QFI36926.1 4-phosphoerythronate dehydrogenase [Moritella marina ATCC 15381]